MKRPAEIDEIKQNLRTAVKNAEAGAKRICEVNERAGRHVRRREEGSDEVTGSFPLPAVKQK